LRGKKTLYYELDYNNYEVVNKNYGVNDKSIYVDFIANTCEIKGSQYVNELVYITAPSVEYLKTTSQNDNVEASKI
jgi:hypothetical protein